VRTLAGGTGVDPEMLHEVTDGNAFYVTEVLAAGHGVPQSVQDAVLARVGRLGARARKVVEAVSTAPRQLEISYVMSLTGAETDDVDETTSAGALVADGGALRFRHELARAAVEDALPLGRRLQLHRQMIALLAEEDSADVARLAHHAARAEAGELVARYAPEAARQASRRGAHREAAEFFELALGHLDHLDSDQLAEIRLDLGLEYNMLDRQTESLTQRELAVAHFRSGNDPVALGKALASLSSQRWTVSDNVGSRAAIDEAIEILEPLGPGNDLARALYISSYLSMLARQHQVAIDVGTRALEMSRQIGSESLVTANILNLGTIEIVTGSPDEGVRLLKEARRRGEEADEHRLVDVAVEMLGSGGGETRYYTEAIPALEEGIELGLKHDYDYIVAYNRAWTARIAFEQGRWDDAVRAAEMVIEGPPGRGAISPVTALGALGRVRVRRGDPGGREALNRALEIGQGCEMQHLWSPMCGLAELAWLERRAEEIPGILRWVYGKALDSDSRWARGEVAFWMWKAGAISGPPARAAEPFAFHMMGEWKASAEDWRVIGCPYEEALALADGDETAMLNAVAIFDRLGGRPAASMVRARLRDRGVDSIPRGPRPVTRANPAGLTPRQSEVLGLMSDGLTNGEIAERLFISKKTVEHHVSAVLSKLGAENRAKAIVQGKRLGLSQYGGASQPE
jgi:DNA-binding CsgD family transcriptional regulator/tetratricopeptide (TPR) repeat protein